MFLKFVNDTTIAPIAFNTTSTYNSSDNTSTRGRGQSSSRGHGIGRGARRPPHFQLCRKDGHYATKCLDLQAFDARPLDANLAEAFQAQCQTSSPDWFVDTGASAYMTPTSSNLTNVASYFGNASVIFSNGHDATISHIGNHHISPNISLLDALVVPKLTKSLIYVSKITQDNEVDVLFSNPMFTILNRHSKETLAQGRRKNGLYVLEQAQQVFFDKTYLKTFTSIF